MLPISLITINRKGVPAAVIMAMAALESGNGASQLSKKYNNYFGMKAKTGQKSIALPTKEIIKGKEVTINANFASYKSPSESAKAFVDLMQSSRYKSALKQKGTQNIIRAIVASGYATANPDIYSSLAMQALERDKSNKLKILGVTLFPALLLGAIFVSQTRGN